MMKLLSLEDSWNRLQDARAPEQPPSFEKRWARSRPKGSSNNDAVGKELPTQAMKETVDDLVVVQTEGSGELLLVPAELAYSEAPGPMKDGCIQPYAKLA